jgi:hypothetical protein
MKAQNFLWITGTREKSHHTRKHYAAHSIRLFILYRGKIRDIKTAEDYKQQEGSNYSLMKFNDAVNDNGMPPIGF